MKFIATILILTGFLFTAMAHSAVITEEVLEFDEWYGVIYKSEGKVIKKEIVVFANSNMASLSVVLINKIPHLMVSSGVRGVKPGINAIVFIDDKEGVEGLIPQLIPGFKRGKMVEINYVDIDNQECREFFSLKGFTKAYRWLSN